MTLDKSLKYFLKKKQSYINHFSFPPIICLIWGDTIKERSLFFSYIYFILYVSVFYFHISPRLMKTCKLQHECSESNSISLQEEMFLTTKPFVQDPKCLSIDHKSTMSSTFFLTHSIILTRCLKTRVIGAYRRVWMYIFWLECVFESLPLSCTSVMIQSQGYTLMALIIISL